MLTWGAFNVIGAPENRRAEIKAAQKQVRDAIEAEIEALRVEHDEYGNRAKAYLYCLEARCPRTGWLVPMAPSWVISKGRRVIAELTPDCKSKRFDISIKVTESAADLAAAAVGTVEKDNRLTYTIDGELYSTPIKTIRGDRKGPDGETINDLRRWTKTDILPAPDDIFQERLYCIQWITKAAW